MSLFKNKKRLIEASSDMLKRLDADIARCKKLLDIAQEDLTKAETLKEKIPKLEVAIKNFNEMEIENELSELKFFSDSRSALGTTLMVSLKALSRKPIPSEYQSELKAIFGKVVDGVEISPISKTVWNILLSAKQR